MALFRKKCDSAQALKLLHAIVGRGNYRGTSRRSPVMFRYQIDWQGCAVADVQMTDELLDGLSRN
jgi:hypothetical protein